ncbi:MAG: hypothetical protein J6L76_05155 [Clostridia bacterium]|nr:hypothetical protein [Clostridia bacterium]
MHQPKITTKRLIACFISMLLPVLAMALRCFLLFADTIFNLAFAITYLIIPVAFIGFFALIIFSSEKKFGKIILIFFVLGAFVVSFFISSFIGTFEQFSYYKNEKIGKHYTQVCADFDLMPTLKEIGNYVQIEHYDYFSQSGLIFTCDADTLIVSYTDEEYQKQKALLDDRYVFQEEPVSSDYTWEPYAEIQNYAFRMLCIEDESSMKINYPKKIIFIATNDQQRSIAYTAFYDDDLDHIQSLEPFLLKECGWKHIVK